MKMTKMRSALLFGLFFLNGCAHYPDVRPGGKGGNHNVIVHESTRESAERGALDQAKSFCDDKYKLSPVVVEQKETKYRGAMDEGTRSGIHAASEVVSIVGFGAAGAAGSAFTSGKDYSSEMTFKCE